MTDHTGSRRLSIRFRILAACLTLTILTAGLGIFTLTGQERLGTLALRMYDQAFMSVDFFRSAQSDFVALRAAHHPSEGDKSAVQLATRILENLDIALERATSAEAKKLATELRGRMLALTLAPGAPADITTQLDAASNMFELGAEQFAQDGFAFRLQAEAVAQNSQLTSRIAIGASLAAALLITASLTRSIVPPLRRATVIATQIAQGNLKNDIRPQGSGEMVLLLGALDVMQTALSERDAAARQIEYMAHHDVLTGVANRLNFSKSLEQALTNAAFGSPFALHLIDLDRFKPVNDTYGHAVGDALLQAVSKRLQRCVREADLVARLGGDEFAVLQYTGSVAQSEQLARRMVSALSRPFDLHGVEVSIGTSVGIRMSDPDRSSQDLLRNADEALYAAKAAGRGTFKSFGQVHLKAGSEQDDYPLAG
jgi:diguanylate cyclase (GGDEF)-like protein